MLTECLKKHQKAFTVTDQNELKNECYVVVDSLTTQNEKNIIEGNKKVMLSRLNDVQFFWKEDLDNGSFADWNQRLASIIFQEGVGSINDKVERICHISHTIMDQLNVDKQFRDIVDRAAHRSKADLVSNMVIELPSQGIMGGYYALLLKKNTTFPLQLEIITNLDLMEIKCLKVCMVLLFLSQIELIP